MKGLIAVVLTFTLACASTAIPPTEEMATTYALLEDAKIGGGEEYASNLMEEARFFYKRAENELKEGNYERAEELRLISEIRAKTVISIGKKDSYEDEIERMEPEINEANSVKRAYENELRKNVSKLEQIKNRIAVSEELTHSNALDMLDKAAEKIEAARDVSAEDFSPQMLNDANQAYTRAEESLNSGENEKSVELAEKAIAFAERAYGESKNKSELRDKVKKRLSLIYGAQVEPVKSAIKVILGGLFAPLGTGILFDAYPSLDVLANVLADYPSLYVTIKAYTTDLKSEEENLNLSQTRAEAVKVYLVSKGLSPERFKVEGLGSGKTLNENKFEDRRIEFVIDLIESGSI